MTIDEAIDVLDEMCRLTSYEQNLSENRYRLIEAFRIFWASRPTEREYAAHTNGMVVTPEILYIMVTSGR